MAQYQKWLDDNWLSERWLKGKFKCLKETPKCAIYPWANHRASRRKCIPCTYLEVTHPDGKTSRFSTSIASKELRREKA